MPKSERIIGGVANIYLDLNTGKSKDRGSGRRGIFVQRRLLPPHPTGRGMWFNNVFVDWYAGMVEMIVCGDTLFVPEHMEGQRGCTGH
jgi:hypothetical protein